MAVMDKFQGMSSVNAGATLDIRPSGTSEAVIHNVYFAGPMELYKTDGTNTVKFDSYTATGARMGLTIHVSNGVYLQVKNTDSVARVLGYDGVYTKA